MADSLLARLDARDRALFDRWALTGRVVTPSACRAWTFLTHLGGATVSIAISLGLVTLGTGSWEKGGQLALATLVISHLGVQLMKRSVGRPRPTAGAAAAALIEAPDRFSFPSGHAAASASLCIGLATAVPVLAPLFAALAVVVGFSRVALGVHFPGDVLVGQLLAVCTAALLLVA